MNEAVLLLSGGMDSGVLLAWAAGRYEKIHGLHVDYGSKHSAPEYDKARMLAERYRASLRRIEAHFMKEIFSSSLLESGDDIPDGPYDTGGISSTVVPFRNGIMLSIAVGYAENQKVPRVLIASHGGDHPIYPDCRQGFTEAMSEAARQGTFAGVTVEAPFSSCDKKAIARIGRDLGFDFTLTYSCYRGGRIHCGRCATCLERKDALGYNQGIDPTEYGA